jgi:Domain of unknown function (DUF1937)
MPKLIYLATPYNHAEPSVREERFQAACKIAAQLMKNGTLLFCPIAHTHPIALAGDLPKGWDYWQEYDRKMLAACDELWIVQMPGWGESVGIAGEIEIANESGKPVHYLPFPE